MQQQEFAYHTGINDYKLILDTPIVVRQKIATVKKSFDEDYKGIIISGGAPFILLASFSITENEEQDIVNKLHQVALGGMPFKVHLKNFDIIEDNEIFIKVEEIHTITTLIQQVKGALNGIDAKYNEIPRISVGDSLQPWQMDKSWKKFARQHFSATFLVKEMLLLKRIEGFKSWQILSHLKFENMILSV